MRYANEFKVLNSDNYNSTEYRKALVANISSRISEDDMIEKVVGIMGCSGYSEQKFVRKVEHIAKWMYKHYVLNFDVDIQAEWFHLQKARQSKAFWFDYAKDVAGQSKVINDKVLLNISQELGIKFKDVAVKYGISSPTLTKYRNKLAAHGAEFPTYSTYNKLESSEKKKLKQNNLRAYANMCASLFFEHDAFMKKTFVFNWLRFVGHIKDMFGFMRKGVSDAIEFKAIECLNSEQQDELFEKFIKRHATSEFNRSRIMIVIDDFIKSLGFCDKLIDLNVRTCLR
jgi:transcriptional regulator with XRE-family HTH domain